MMSFIRRWVAMLVTGLPLADLNRCLEAIKQQTGASEIIFHLDETVSGIMAGRRTTLGRVGDFL